MTKTILDIPAPSGNNHIFWEHAMKSVFAFVGMFALLFFGPIFMEGRRRGDKGEGLGADILEYMMNHPEVQFTLCVVAVAVYNLYVVVRNTPKKYAVGIRIKEDVVEVDLTNLYYKKVETKSVALNDFYYIIESKEVSEKEKRQTLKLMDSSVSQEIGIIKPKHLIWEKHLVQIKNALIEMKELGLDRKGSNS